MITTKKITELLKSWDTEEIERHCIFNYLKNNKINYSNSVFLSNYLNDFEEIKPLSNKINILNIKSIKDLENSLELIIPVDDRKLNGAFFTPDYIVDFIIENITPKENETNLDPSCGCGAFFVGLLKYYKTKYNKNIKDTIRENIFGTDLMTYNIRRTKLILSLFALENNEILEEDDFNLLIQDSIRTDWRHVFNKENYKFDNIIGNPPYVKFQDLTDDNRNYLAKNFKTIKNGTFNLYFAFFELGYRLIKDTGKLGYITPNNYFTSLAGEPLRSFFQNKQCINRIVDFKDKKVFDAQTYTAITFLNKKTNSELFYDRIPDSLNPNNFIKNVNGSPNKIKELNSKKWRLLKTSEQKNIKIIENIGLPIGKLFNIAVGIATLKDEIYFLDKSLEKENCYIKTYHEKGYYIEKGLTKTIYKISDFKSQSEIVDNKRKIIFPYKIVKGNALPYTENELKNKYPRAFEYFSVVKTDLAKRDKGKVVNPFFAYGRTQGLTRKGKMLLTPTFSQYPRFLIAPETDAFFCNGYGIYYNEISGGLWKNSINPIAKIENIIALQKILNSEIMNYYVNVTSVSIQGGYPCYQKNFIEKFTIPDFSEEELATLSLLNEKTDIDAFLIEKYQLNLPVPNLVS